MSDQAQVPAPPAPPVENGQPAVPPGYALVKTGPVLPAEKPWYFQDWCWIVAFIFLGDIGFGASLALVAVNPYLTKGGKWLRVGIMLGVVLLVFIGVFLVFAGLGSMVAKQLGAPNTIVPLAVPGQ